MARRVSAPMFAGGTFPLLLIFIIMGGCGGTETTASRSAAAYDEAQRKETPLHEAAGHGGRDRPDVQHGTAASPRAGDAAAPDMPGMEHSARPAAERPMRGMDHSRMPGTRSSGRPMDHSSMPGVKHSGTRTDHSKMPGMIHPAPSPPAPMPPPPPEPPAAAAKPGQPAATLSPDPIDQPAPTAVADAARAAAMAAEMAAGAHGMSHGTYRQIDAGRGQAAPPTPKPSPKTEHKH